MCVRGAFSTPRLACPHKNVDKQVLHITFLSNNKLYGDMSTFVDISCYDDAGPEGGNLKRLRRSDLEEAVKSLPKYEVVNESGAWGVKLPGIDAIAVLEGGGMLSCQLDSNTDIDNLLDRLRPLASALPNAFITDEEGEFY